MNKMLVTILLTSIMCVLICYTQTACQSESTGDSGANSASESGKFSKELVTTGDEAIVGQVAPNFTLVDSKGIKHSLADFKGKFVILEWTNFGCPFVGKHYDTNSMQKLQKRCTGGGNIWLSICSSAPGRQGNYPAAEINSIIKQKFAAPSFYLIDEDGAVARVYGAKCTPTMYIVDKEGKLVYKGGIDDKPNTDARDIAIATNYMKRALDEIEAGQPISFQGSKPYGCPIKYNK